MSDIVLHHYPTSPYSEKVRLAFGAKGLAWKSVIIPVIMPKPDVVALTGGYRKTPVMQIGADIYCDTACILRELERRHPSPTLYPAPEAEPLASWAETEMFGAAAGMVFGNAGEKVPQEFIEDRAKFSGRDFNPERMKAALPYVTDQMRAALALLDAMLAAGRPFLLGPTVSAADLAAYHPLWFVLRWVGKPIAPLTEFPRVLDWMERIKAIGHGSSSPMDSAAAIELARASTPAEAPAADPNDPAGRKPGERVSVAPDDTGREPTTGEIVRGSALEIVIRRSDERAGTLHVHFPRLGFVVSPAKA